MNEIETNLVSEIKDVTNIFKSIDIISTWEERVLFKGYNHEGIETTLNSKCFDDDILEQIAKKYNLRYYHEYGCRKACSGLCYEKTKPDFSNMTVINDTIIGKIYEDENGEYWNLKEI